MHMKENADMKKENKKKLITTAVAAVVLLAVLIALNSIDFDSIDIDALYIIKICHVHLVPISIPLLCYIIKIKKLTLFFFYNQHKI